MVGEIIGADWVGERFTARLRGRVAADWLDVAPDGTALYALTSDGISSFPVTPR